MKKMLVWAFFYICTVILDVFMYYKVTKAIDQYCEE